MENDFIPTKKKNVRYHFVNTRVEDIDKEDDYSFFYQICAFPDPYSKKYELRKFVINKNNEFLQIKKYILNKKQCKKFYKTKKKGEYLAYPVYNLDEIEYPKLGEILTCKSQNIMDSYDYSGFAPF